VASKNQRNISTRKSQKKPRKSLSYFGRKESYLVSESHSNATSSYFNEPFRISSPATTTPLPSTPNAFHLTSSMHRVQPPKSFPDHPSTQDMTRMQSDYRDAFGQLRRSLEDGDERFILRMQEWELRHSAFHSGANNTMRTSPLSNAASSGAVPDDLRFDDDDIEIIVHSDISPQDQYTPSGFITSTESTTSSPSVFLNHRSSYEDLMDEDELMDDSASPSLQSSTTFSNGVASSMSRGGLSSSSSFSSLVLPGSGFSHEQPQRKSDRAIAALSLALANGAAGLEDYHNVLQTQESTPSCDAGGLWD